MGYRNIARKMPDTHLFIVLISESKVVVFVEE